VLRPRGRIALVDVSEPASAPARAVHALWFRRVVPFVGGLLSDRRAYSYLPASTAYLPPRPELLQMVGAAGFVDVTHRTLGAGAAQLITGARA
jgi:demethylmenaquinone methyltransferase/2-methoxy-6-polyprenyl-1,4-benzoquinol methylase